MNAEHTEHTKPTDTKPMDTKHSFYETAWLMSFALVKDWLRRESSLRHIKKSKSKFIIFNADLEESEKALIPCETLSEAVTKMLSIVQSKPKYRIYHVSLWQLHGDLTGTFHRVGYAEDEIAHPIISKPRLVTIWHELDKMMSDKVYKEI